MINVKTNKKTGEQLSELSAKRKANLEQVRSKQDIVAELVDKAHKKECKND